MGPLSTLLTLPVGGPLGALTWIARQIANAADQEMLDPTRIEAALLLLERRLEDGLIDEPAFEAEEARLLEELAEISALRAAKASAASTEAAAEEAGEPEAAGEPEVAGEPEAESADPVAREAAE